MFQSLLYQFPSYAPNEASYETKDTEVRNACAPRQSKRGPDSNLRVLPPPTRPRLLVQ